MRRRILPVLLLLSGCAEPQPLRIGVVMSGHPAEAAVIAAEAVARSGAAVLEVELRSSGTPVAADTALVIAAAFVDDARIIAVVGHANSAASLAASQVYNRGRLIHIAPTTTATVFGEAGPYSFRLVPGDDRQAAFLAHTIREAWGEPRIALAYVNDDYGRNFFRELRTRLAGIVWEGAYAEPVTGADMAELATRIAAARPDLMVWAGRPPALKQALPTLRAELPGISVLCGDACDSADVYRNVDGAFTDVRFVRFVDPEDPSPGMQAFRDTYAARTGRPAAAEAVLTYDAVLAIAAAVDGGARNREQVRRFLAALGRDRAAVQGLAGPIRFDESGTVIRAYLLAEVTRGGVRPIPSKARD
jgi:branched-chain amino acid transport system substrate-binding protein